MPLVPTDTPGFVVEEMLWTFNMPTDHGRFTLTDVRVPHADLLGDADDGWRVAITTLMNERVAIGSGGGGRRQGARGAPEDSLGRRRAVS